MTARNTDLAETLEKQKTAFETFQAAHENFIAEHKTRQAEIVDRLESIEARQSSPGKTVTGARAELKALESYVRTGQIEHKDMSIGSGPDGGVTVPKVIAQEIVSRAIARSPLASIVRVTTASTSDYRRILNLRGAADNWVGETGARNDTATPLLREITFPHGELYAVPVVTNWALQDSQFDLANFVSENVQDTFAKSLEAAVVYGDGSDKPKGIFAAEPVARADGDSPERDQDVIELYDQADSPGNLADALVDLYFRCKPEYRQRGRWLMSSATLSVVRKLKGSDGHYLWQPNLGAGVDTGDGMLLGKPVVTSEEFANVDYLNSPTFGSPILFGDFDVGYELVRIGDMTVIRDQVTAKGKTKLYFAQRFGGRIVDNDALKVLFV